MIEDLDENNNQEEQEQLTCPECGKGFQDMRGLTSHARHKHAMGKDKIIALTSNEQVTKNKGGSLLKILGGIGGVILALISIGRLR